MRNYIAILGLSCWFAMPGCAREENPNPMNSTPKTAYKPRNKLLHKRIF